MNHQDSSSIKIGNTEEFRRAVAAFQEFERDGRLDSEERAYKKRLIRVLGAVLARAEIENPQFKEKLQAALRECSKEISNLADFRTADDIRKYVADVTNERLQELFLRLLYGSESLVTRVNWFKEQVDSEIGVALNDPRKKIHLALISIFLTAAFPDKCTFYRATLMGNAARKWNIAPISGDSAGEKYESYMQNMLGLQAAFGEELGYSPDLVDTHSALWINRDRGSDKEDELEEDAKAEHQFSGHAIWKIAPGRGASEWEMCRVRNCIVIGWSNLGNRDLREFSNKQEIEQALTAVGVGAGGAASIWNFVHEIKANSLVVANQGLTDVVGIGIVTSNYIPPNDPQNPSTNSQMRHARRVDWRIIAPVHVDFQFGQQTAAPVKPAQWAKIKQAYAEQHPELLSEIEKLERGEFSNSNVPIQTESRQVQNLMGICKETRNIILYGPPGTGKTYNVQRFRDAFLAPQLRKAVPVQEQHLALVSELNWYEAIALTMILGAPKTHFRVQELLDSEPIRLMMQFKQREKNVANTLWSYLQTHTSPNVETVRFTNRRDPFLFAKSAASEWFLTDEGKAWANDNLAQTFEAWRNPSSQQIDINQFFDFITFHQSFAYEEFVEGLKPLEPEDDATFVQYRVMSGVFKKICERAMRDPQNNYLLIIDEINRANISKVFGELITLIEDDKRLGEDYELKVRLSYSQQEFGVPANVYILGTMNTADRSIALLDIALRRRFTFVEMMPLLEKVSENVAGVDLRALLERMNARITALLDRDHQLGHSYLMNLENADNLRFAWYHRVVPLLQEYFYNDDQRLRAVLGTAFFEKRPEAKIWEGGAPEMLDTETEHFDLQKFESDDQAFLNALRAIYKPVT